MTDTPAGENNFVTLVPFNGTDGPGGNPLVDDMNIWYQVGLIARTSALQWRPARAGGVADRARSNALFWYRRAIWDG